MEDKAPQQTKSCPSNLVEQIAPMVIPEKHKLEALEYIDHTCNYNPVDNSSEKDLIETREEWIIVADVVHKALVG